MMSYACLESCTYNNYTFENESSGTLGEPYYDDVLSASSSKERSESSSSPSRPGELEEGQRNDESLLGPKDFHAKEKSTYTMKLDDVYTMKERFSKLLLGEDLSGGSRGLSTALALSNAITNLAGSVFGELWKLEPLSEGRRRKWSREMDWLLSPANYMVELVPAKQRVPDGKCLEVMTARVRSDIQINLPALKKLDAMLIGLLDSMVDTEFWYAEGGSKAEGRSKSRRQTKKWWLPVPRVPSNGISPEARKKLVLQSEAIRQMLKAVKSINEQVISEMLIPQAIFDTFPKTIKACLGESLYKTLAINSGSGGEILQSINLTSEDEALHVANRLQMAIFSGKQRLSSSVAGKEIVWNSWSFAKDSEHEVEKTECCLQQVEAVVLQLKLRFPNLPQTVLDITRVEFNKDIGHSILEAYSRVLGNLAYTILLRIMDVLHEDEMTKDHLEKQHNPVTEFGSHRQTEVHKSSGAIEDLPPDMLSKRSSSAASCHNNNGLMSSERKSVGNGMTKGAASTAPSRGSSCYGRESCSTVNPVSSP